MKTVKDSGQSLISIHTQESRPEIPPGSVRITTVQYRTYEYTREELEQTKGSFKVHDANCEEAKLIASLVKS